MPRPLLVRSSTHSYHITARCNNKEFFPLPMDKMWSIFLSHLSYINKEFAVSIHAFVLMGNHFHLLCHTPHANIDKAMMIFMKRISDEVHFKTKSMNHLWGSRYKWSLIQSQGHYYQVYKYIYQNPLRAKIVANVQSYPYSTLQTKVPFPLHSFLSIAFGGKEGEFFWLNDVFKEDLSDAIRKGLRKGNFKLNQKVPGTF